MSALRQPPPPPVALEERQPREPRERDVLRLQGELGIREQPRLASYGTGSHFTEEMLFRAYSNANPDLEIG